MSSIRVNYILICLQIFLTTSLIHAETRRLFVRNRPTNNERQHQQPTESSLSDDLNHPLSKDDFERGKKLDPRKFAINDKVLYSSNRNLFEGDMAEDLMSNLDEKNSLRNPSSHWPKGRVPYVISSEFSSDDRAVIARAMDEYHRQTCVKFVPHDGQEPNYIHIVGGSGCSSRVGLAGGMQKVTLGVGCVTVGIVEHELMHALGFVHEQSRTDRDSYIKINRNNIIQGLETNFHKYSVQEIDNLGEPYDYGSVLHYGPTAFTNGRGPTIETRDPNAHIGQRNGLSKIDIDKINKIYKCPRVLEPKQVFRPNSITPFRIFSVTHPGGNGQISNYRFNRFFSNFFVPFKPFNDQTSYTTTPNYQQNLVPTNQPSISRIQPTFSQFSNGNQFGSYSNSPSRDSLKKQNYHRSFYNFDDNHHTFK